MKTACPFCGADPYDYVNNGVGMESVAVTCCELGIEYYAREPSEEITLSRGEFERIASAFHAMRTLGMNPQIFD